MGSPILLRGQRGVLFTFLTFLLIGVLLGLVLFRVNVDKRYSQETIEVSVLNAINAKYDDITDDIVTLDHPIGIPSITQRILPFTYRVDTNAVSIQQTLPIESGKLALYYDLLNAYTIFVRDQNTQTTFDGTLVDMNVPKPLVWGGTAQSAGFNILPQCLQYRILDVNHVSFDGNNTIGCENPLNADLSIQRIDINLSFPTTVDDYNVVTCSFDGVGGCPHQDYNESLGPFLNVQVLDTNCSRCALSTADKNISSTFNSGAVDSIMYACSGPSCTSDPIILYWGNGLQISHVGTPVVVSTTIQFTNGVDTFYYQDANYNVRKTGFTTYKSNVVVFPK